MGTPGQCFRTTLLYVDSQDITVGDVNNFKVYTNNSGISDVLEYAVQDITIPFTWNTIRTGRDTIQWTASVDGVLIISLNPGNYTATDLATELTTAMNAVSTAGTYTVTYDSITQGFDITVAGDTIRILQTDLDASNLWDELGFTEPYTLAANTQISVSAVNITGDNRLYVTSSTLANTDSYESTENNLLEKSLNIATAIVDVNPGGIVQDKKNEMVWRHWPDANITNFDLQLRHSNGDLVDLRGRYWQITIVLRGKLY